MNDKEMIIDGEVWVRKADVEMAKNAEGLEYCIIRAAQAGVFAGFLESRIDGEVFLLNARRLWYWDGAASLSELAMRGVSKPEKCKFPCPVEKIAVLGVIEVIPCTEAARKSIEEVPEWTAR